MRDKVAIIGLAHPFMRQALEIFPREDFEVWTLSQVGQRFPEAVKRADRWFEIHSDWIVNKGR